MSDTAQQDIERMRVVERFLVTDEGELGLRAAKAQLFLKFCQPDLKPEDVVRLYHDAQAIDRFRVSLGAMIGKGQMAAHQIESAKKNG